MSEKWYNLDLKTPKQSGSLRIGSTCRNRVKLIYTKSKFFKERVYYKHDEENGILIFGKPTMMFSGTTVKPIIRNPDSYIVQITCSGIPDGEYYFDEESTEDEIYIYYRDQNKERIVAKGRAR